MLITSASSPIQKNHKKMMMNKLIFPPFPGSASRDALYLLGVCFGVENRTAGCLEVFRM